MKPVTSLHRSAPSRNITTIVIGAGQAGLAMSRCLTDASINHVILERGEVANSWRKERWDSLKLLTPNWQSRLAGYKYQGDDPDGFMSATELTAYLADYSRTVSVPIHTGINVTRVTQTQNGYHLITNDGEWQCRTLVIASGACNIPIVPKIAAGVPGNIESLTPMQYRNPDQLNEGGVLIVGASATGLQLASEIQSSGRQVTVATGEQVRMPRQYRGKDIMWWMDQCGLLDTRYDEVDDIERARRVPSAQLVGGRNLDINSAVKEGVEIVGRLSTIQNNTVQFSGSLAHVCKMADLKMRRLTKAIDEWILTQGFGSEIPEPCDLENTKFSSPPRLNMNLVSGEIKTVLWATGFRPDYSWLKVPVLDKKGYLKHDGGIVSAPGLYVLGLPFMRRRKSVFLDGVADDARDLTEHMNSYLQSSWQSGMVSVA